MISRVLGLVRDVMMAALLGAGPMAQAFLIAFSLPNMFRRFFGEGAFNLAFVPMFAKKLEAGGDGADPHQLARDFANDAMSGLAAVLIVITLVGMALMPWLVLAMASGFAGDERFTLSVLYGRIAFPYLIFISLTALLCGVLNATGRFALAAAAPILMNVVMITFLAVGWATGGDIGMWQIWSVPVAGIAQLWLTWWGADKAGMKIRFRRPRFTPELKRLARIMGPAVLAGGVVQVNLLVGRQVGSFFDGAVAWLSYADRLYQLPLGVVGSAIGVVLLPDLSRRLAARGEGERTLLDRRSRSRERAREVPRRARRRRRRDGAGGGEESLRATAFPRAAIQRHPGRAGSAGTHGGHDVIAAYRRGDVGLRSVDHEVVAVSNGRGPQVPDIGTPARFGDRQRADQLAGQGRLDEFLDQPRITGRDHVRNRDTDGEQRCEHPTWDARLVQFLADDRDVGRIAALAADRFGEAHAEQSGRCCLAGQLAGEFPDPLPLLYVRQDLPFGEGPHALSQFLTFGRSPDAHRITSGISMCRLRSHSPSPLACGSNRAW